MQSADIATKLAELGGSLVSDRDGTFWRFRRGECTVEVEPFRLNQKWGFDCAVEHRGFAELVNRISGAKRSEFVCVKWFQRIQEDDESFESFVNDALSTGLSLTLADCVSVFLGQIPEKYVPQLCHIAALAMEGDFTSLLEYQDQLRGGNRRNFVPLVDGEVLGRAVDIALKNSS